MKFLILIFFNLILSLQPSSACTCAEKPPLADELKLTHAILIGRCISATYHPDWVSNEYVFQVERAWKEKLPERVSVYSVIWGSACGYIFVPGHRYIVWATLNQVGAHMQTNICTRTDEAESPKAIKDLEALGAPAVQHTLPK